MAAIDAVIGAAINGVRKSGALESGALMATVTAVGTDGTVTVERGTDTYPKVRVLSGYTSPRTGDLVEIMKTAGGWVCIGSLRLAPQFTPWTVIPMASGYRAKYSLPEWTREGNWVTLRGNVERTTSAALPVSTETTVGTLPAEARPTRVTYFTGTGAGAEIARITVRDSGELQFTLRSGSISSTWMGFDLVYRND